MPTRAEVLTRQILRNIYEIERLQRLTRPQANKISEAIVQACREMQEKIECRYATSPKFSLEEPAHE